MPDKTGDIQTAILSVVKPGEQLTLAELDERLLRGYPVLAGEDRRWIGVAVSKLIQDSRLSTDNPDSFFAADMLIRRPADG